MMFTHITLCFLTRSIPKSVHASSHLCLPTVFSLQQDPCVSYRFFLLRDVSQARLWLPSMCIHHLVLICLELLAHQMVFFFRYHRVRKHWVTIVYQSSLRGNHNKARSAILHHAHPPDAQNCTTLFIYGSTWRCNGDLASKA